MASFVTDVLTSAGHLEAQEATSKLQVLSKKIDGLKVQIYNVTKNKYSNFITELKTAEQLVEDVQGVKEEMEDVSNKIENEIKSQLNMSTSEFQSLTGQLQEVSCIVTVLEKLVTLQEALESVSSAMMTQEYGKAADILHQIQDLLKQPVYDQDQEFSILVAIREESHILKEKLHFDLGEKWRDLIVWNVPDDKAKSQKVEVGLKLMVGGDNCEVLQKVVIGMEKLHILDEKLRKFGDRLVTHVLQPVITNNTCEIVDQTASQAKVLTVTVTPATCPTPPTPEALFIGLVQILKFLSDNMLKLCVGEISPEVTLMERLGEAISSDVLHTAVKECLIHAIPSNNRELSQFNSVISLTEGFHAELLKLHFIDDSNTILLDYIQNVNVLFANKKCAEVLERARNLMTSEVHNTVVVSHDRPLGDLPALVEGGASKKARKTDLMLESPLSANTFKLPTCHISLCIQQVMTLAYETLYEATESSPQCAIQMFYAIRNMFELFCSVFPTYHKQSLDTLPQLTALHYNNCMFIAHHLMTLGHQFSKKLPPSINTTFVDLVPKIRRLGTESFMVQLAKQKAQMSDYLKAANGFLNVSEEESFFSAERAVKQVLHQLNHLKNVWQEVLPASNYRKAIGTLLNSVVMEMTDSIVALEDISANDTKQLSGLLSMIMDRAHLLMEIQGGDNSNTNIELLKNVPRWQRCKELDLVLNASLLDIGDRWAAGKGPLAVEFSANEVKQLIRALFQNTDRRASVLAKIK